MARTFLAASSQSLSVADTAVLQRGTGDFTLCGWVAPSVTSYGPANAGTIISKNHTGVEIFLYQGNLNAYVGGTSNALPGISWPYALGVWGFVALQRVGTLCTLRVGGATSTVNNSASISNAGTALTFGNRPGGSGLFLSGSLAHWAMYSVGITDYGGLTQGAPYRLVRPDSLIEYWPMDGKTSPERGLRQGLSATLVNAPGDGSASGPRLYF